MLARLTAFSERILKITQLLPLYCPFRERFRVIYERIEKRSHKRRLVAALAQSHEGGVRFLDNSDRLSEECFLEIRY